VYGIRVPIVVEGWEMRSVVSIAWDGGSHPSGGEGERFARFWRPGSLVLLIFVAEADLAIGHGDFFSSDEDLLDIGFNIQRIAVCNHDVGGLADIE